MTFAAPLFLIAVLAGIIPVVLHMIHRQKALEVPFSTLRFLRVSVQRTRRRKYVDDVALMAVRVAALVLIALALARPAVTSLKALWGRRASTAVAIVLDNSGSMATVDNGKPRFETARQAVEQILDLLRDGDAVALFLTGGPPAPEQGKLYHTQETVRQVLAQGRPSAERADLAARLQEARTLLAGADTSAREIYVITDNQAISWEALGRESGDRGQESGKVGVEVPVVLINVNRDPAPNVALRGLRLESPAPVAGVPIQARVEVVNTSTVPQQKHLELHVDGSKETVSPTLNIPPGGTLKHEFQFALDRAGVHGGEIRLAEDDGSPLDNRLFFALAVDQQIPVAVVKPPPHEIPYEDDSFYLEGALAAAESIRVKTLTPEELGGETLAGYTVVFCVNLRALDTAGAGRLRDYVAGGGHLFWVCGDNVRPDDYNRMNEQAGGGLLPAPLAERRDHPAKGESWTIGALDKDHPSLGPLIEPASVYKSVLVYKHFRFDWPEQTEGRVLARLDDNQPLLVERKAGPGTVLMLGTGAHVEWTNLPLKPLFLPLFARLTFYLSGAEAAHTQVLAGAPLVVPFEGGVKSAEVEVVRPSGEVLRVRNEEPDAPAFRYFDTHETGIYLLRVTGGKQPKQYAFAVNMDPDESDPATISAEELKARFGKHPFFLSDNPEDVAGTIKRLREGESLWELLLAAVLVGLVLEVFLANRFGGKLPGSAAGQAPAAASVMVQAEGPREQQPLDFGALT